MKKEKENKNELCNFALKIYHQAQMQNITNEKRLLEVNETLHYSTVIKKRQIIKFNIIFFSIMFSLCWMFILLMYKITHVIDTIFYIHIMIFVMFLLFFIIKYFIMIFNIDLDDMNFLGILMVTLCSIWLVAAVILCCEIVYHFEKNMVISNTFLFTILSVVIVYITFRINKRIICNKQENINGEITQLKKEQNKLLKDNKNIIYEKMKSLNIPNIHMLYLLMLIEKEYTVETLSELFHKHGIRNKLKMSNDNTYCQLLVNIDEEQYVFQSKYLTDSKGIYKTSESFYNLISEQCNVSNDITWDTLKKISNNNTIIAEKKKQIAEINLLNNVKI